MGRAITKKVNVRKVHKKIKDSFKVFLKFEPFIKLIYLYGSSTKSIKPKQDIDILIIIDDTLEVSDLTVERIRQEVTKITYMLKKEKLLLHVQPLKSLSFWWKLLIEGEPWIITSIQNNIVIYDKDNLMPEIKKFVNKKLIYSKSELAEKLLEKAEKTLILNRDLLLETALDLSDAATEAAQLLLLFDNKWVFNKTKILKLLKKKYKESLDLDAYEEIIDIEEKIKKGVLTEFTGKNLHYYIIKIKYFISQIENQVLKLSEGLNEKQIKKS